MHEGDTLMDRRTFTQLSALTLAGAAVPLGAQGTRPVGFAAVGLGTISDIFMRACQGSQKARIAGLVTGHPQEKGTKYGAQYGVPSGSIYTYETFDHIRDNPAIEAVYIGLPNSMHAEYTIRAAEAGKHVLCEKPMAISSAECRSMIDACRNAKVKLMIAYRVHYDPTWTRALELIRSGAIGQVQAFDGNFPGQQRAGAWRLDRKLAGGGSLLDLGIYPMNGIRYLTGEEPAAYSAMVATREAGPRFTQMEQSIQFQMRFPSGILATAASSYGQNGRNYLKVFGDKGSLEISPAFSYDGLRLTGQTSSGPIDEAATGKQPFQFTLEAEHFADCVRGNLTPKTPGEEGLADLVAMEAIYKAAGTPIA
jgi:predicted dehydrogenase